MTQSTKTTIFNTIKPLGFDKYYYVEGRASIADLFKPQHRCGIYLLHFANNEFYVGQAVDVTRRFVQHTKNHHDIVGISFQQVDQNELNNVERKIIHYLESRNFVLRNIALTSIPITDSDFDTIMPPVEQEKWLSDSSKFDENGTRPINNELRQKYSKRFQQFLNKPQAEQAILATREYVQKCIPVPKNSEISFWSCTCLPATNSPSQLTILLRINMFWQEVFVAYLDNKNQLRFEIQVAKDSLGHGKKYWALRLRFPSVDFIKHAYDSGGRDQMRLWVNSEATLQRLLQNATTRNSMQELNLRLAKKGPCNSSRNHCLDLADRLFEN